MDPRETQPMKTDQTRAGYIAYGVVNGKFIRAYSKTEARAIELYREKVAAAR